MIFEAGSTPLGPVIAVREFTARRARRKVPVTVRIGTPYPRPTGEWACPFEVTGLGRKRLRHCFGFDAFQALQLVPQAIRAELQKDGANVTWLGLDLEVVLPRPVPAITPAQAVRLNTLIEKELARFLRVAERRFTRSRA